MSIIQPVSARHHADLMGGQFVIVIPSRKQWFHILFLAFWLVGWFIGWTSAATELITYPSGADGFLVVWLIGWTAGGVYAVTTLLWMLLGQDRVEITHDLFHVRRQIAGIGRTQSFDIIAISDLRVTQYPAQPSYSWGRQRNTLSTVWKLDGPITFDYGAKTYHFGDGVDEAEAKQIVTRIQQQFPALL
jgi:hypothetical protein